MLIFRRLSFLFATELLFLLQKDFRRQSAQAGLPTVPLSREKLDFREKLDLRRVISLLLGEYKKKLTLILPRQYLPAATVAGKTPRRHR